MAKVGLALFAMARPLQLLAVTAVYLIGVAMAVERGYDASVSGLVIGYAALILVSASIHYSNEYADYETDALTTRTPFSGGSGALPRSGLSRVYALRGAQFTLVTGSIIAAIGLLLGELTIAALFVLATGGFFGWMYSLPPLALAWHGWGELDNAALGGVVLPLYGYTVAAGHISLAVIAMCLPFGALVFINLLATTWPDRQADAQVGKFTLATQWPTQRLRRLYLTVAIMAFVLLWLNVIWTLPLIVALGGLLVLPMVVWGNTVYTRQESPFPTVAAMVLMMNIYLLGWGGLALDLL